MKRTPRGHAAVANRDVLPMRGASLCTAAFGMFGLLVVAPAAAQDMMQHVDLTSPEMTAAEMTRAEVEAAIAAATSTQPADFTGKKLSGLDLSGLDLSGASSFPPPKSHPVRLLRGRG